MNRLTDNQKAALIWIVEQVRSGLLPEEEMRFSWTKDGVDIDGVSGQVPQFKRTTLTRLESAGFLDIRIHKSNYYFVSLNAESYEAVDSEFGTKQVQTESLQRMNQSVDRRKVFVVHGRNLRLRDAMYTFLGALKLDPIEWSEAIRETGKGSPYVGEILDTAFSKARAVVVLLTPDDEAILRSEFFSEDDEPFERELRGQARPNVLFEAGMAFGHHPEQTILVQVGNLRPFSDIAGRHIIHMDDSVKKRKQIADRLKSAGCNVSIDGERWMEAGDFSVLD